MPCYRYKFAALRMPLDFHGHALPPALVQIILNYAYEMTVHEDAVDLCSKLDEMLAWLHGRKVRHRQGLAAYEVLARGCQGNDKAHRERLGTSRLLHHATVAMATVLHPTPRRRARPTASFWGLNPREAQPQGAQGFILPEMANYV